VKKLILIGAIAALCGVMAWAAAPVAITTASVVAVDTLRNTQTYGGTWKNVSNCIYGLTDSATILMRVTGYAVGNPGSRMYIGLSTDAAGATAGPTLDTAIVEFPKALESAGGMVRVPFSLEFATTYVSQTDIIDTIFFKACTGASSTQDIIFLFDVCQVVQVGDLSAAFN
jgi:hypothetical protein